MSIELQAEKKRKREPKVWGDLPPRVIVHEILVHHLLPESTCGIQNYDTRPDSEPPRLDHFGIFTRDRRRNIWFMFSSAEVEVQLRQILDYRRIEYLFVKAPEEELIIQLKYVSTRMRLTRALKIQGLFPSSAYSLFSKENCFPSIQSLDIFHGFIRNDFEVCPKTNIFQRIRELKLSIFFDLSKKNESTILSNLANLDSIILWNAKFPKRFDLNLPNVRKLELDNVRNLHLFRNDEKIKELKIGGTYEESSFRLFEDLYKRCRNIQVLEINSFSEEKGSRMNTVWFNPKWNPLENVKEVSMRQIKGYEGLPSYSFGENIEKLTIIDCEHLQEDFYFNREYKRLTRLELGGFPKPTRKWKIFKNVESLVLRGRCIPSRGSLETLFSIHKEELSKKLKELRFLFWHEVRGTVNEEDITLNDDFLGKVVLKELRRLEFHWCDMVVGNGLKRENFGNLEEVSVHICKKFDVERFKESF